jgi:Excalibur calcium-binding domain
VLPIAGRAAIPGGVSTVVLNVAVDQPQIAGYVTVYPCDAPPPTASNLNYVTDQAVPNAVISKLSAAGTACLFTSGATHLIVDVAGYFANATALVPLGAPARLLDTGPGGITADGALKGTRLRPTSGTVQLSVAGRASIPADASAVVLNVTVDQIQAAGYITVYPTGVGRPNASTPPTPPPTVPPTNPPTQPPSNPGDNRNCTDFATYTEAKAYFDTYVPYYGDVSNLDSDGDGIPCETLPGHP